MIAPKCYAIVDANSQQMIKARFKGISSSARFIDPDVVNSLPPHEQQAVRETFGTDGNSRLPTTQRPPIVYYGGFDLLQKFPLALTAKVFQRILDGDPVYIVQSQIVKNIFEALPEVTPQMGILRQRFVAKSIVLSRNNKRSSLSCL
jgi:hypothetical protein